MTDERTLNGDELDELERLYEGSTAGEWIKRQPEEVYGGEALITGKQGELNLMICAIHSDIYDRMDDAAFIAAAHNAMPALIAMARRVAALERLSAAADELKRIEELSPEDINRQWDDAYAELYAANQRFKEAGR